jgi:hypothetical protein
MRTDEKIQIPKCSQGAFENLNIGCRGKCEAGVKEPLNLFLFKNTCNQIVQSRPLLSSAFAFKLFIFFGAILTGVNCLKESKYLVHIGAGLNPLHEVIRIL